MTGPSLCLVGDACRGVDQAGQQIPPRDVWDQGYLCGPCRKRLTRWVAELPSQYDELALVLTVTGRSSEGRSSEPSNLELNMAVAEHRDHLRCVLWSWAKVVIDERGVTRPAVDTPHAVCAWLGIHLEWVAHQPFAADLYTEIGELRRRAFSLANPSGRKRIPAGPCRVDGCTGKLWGLITPSETLEFPAELTCDTCDYTLPSHRWLNVLVKGRAA